jgi:signal transduction histidine kinase
VTADKKIHHIETTLNTLLFIFGVIIFLLGSVGLIAWVSALATTTAAMSRLSLNEISDPSLILIGSLLLLLAKRYWRMVKWGSFIGVLISLVTFVVWGLYSDFTLAWQDLRGETANTPYLLTALILLLAILSFYGVGLSRRVLRQHRHTYVLLILGILITVASGLLLTQKSSWLSLDVETHFLHGLFSVALGFAFVGGSFLLISLAQYMPFILDKTLFLVIIVVLAISGSFVLWQQMLERREWVVQQTVGDELEEIKHEITQQLFARLSALERMAQRWQVRQGTPEAEWRADAEALLTDYPGYQALQWVDAKFTIRWVVPEQGNTAALARNAQFESSRQSALQQAYQQHAITITPSVDLVQGGQGFLIYYPLYVQQRFDGLLTAVVKNQTFFSQLISTQLSKGYAFALEDNQGQRLYQRGESPTAYTRTWQQQTELLVYGVPWQITIWPTQQVLEQQYSLLPTVTLLIGLLISVLLGVALRLAKTASARAQQVSTANHALQQSMLKQQALEAEQRQLQQVMWQNQKMQSLGTLAGGVAHDFNNILYAISGYVNMACDDTKPGSITHENMKKVLEACARGQELVKQILGFSRKQDYVLTEVSLREVIEKTLSLLEASVPVEVQLHCRVDLAADDLGLVKANLTQLQQVLINLINNAIAAMQSRGEITINLHRQVADARFAEQYPQLSKPAYYHLSVHDTGPGMDSATQARIFEPFFTTKSVDEGTGLGLAMAYGIMQDHQGGIFVDSQPGQGTTFHLYIPVLRRK